MKKIKVIMMLSIFLLCTILSVASVEAEEEKEQTSIFGIVEGRWRYFDSPVSYAFNGIIFGRIFLLKAHVNVEDRLLIGSLKDGSYDGYLYYDGVFEKVYGNYELDENEFTGTWWWRRGYGTFYGQVS